MSAELKQALESTTVGTVETPKGRVVTIPSTEAPVHGFQTLVENDILSAPVEDVTTHKYTGFLDIRDLVSFVVFIFDENKMDGTESLRDLVDYGIKMFQNPVDGVTVTYLSRRNQFHPVKNGSSLLSTIELLAKGLHRVPVVDEQGKVVNVVSQSSVVHFLNANISKFGPEANRTIGELKLGSRPVVIVNRHTKAIDVFKLMDKKKLSGLAITDDNGALINHTNARDLKLWIKNPPFDLLLKPIDQFLEHIRQAVPAQISTTTVTESDTLATALSKLQLTRLHRLFVVDQNNHPIAVISITDIMKHILKLVH